jgi:hypothetical protein
MASYKVLSKHPVGRPWLARVQKAGKRQNLGYFATEQEALKAEAKFRAENGMADTVHLGRANVKPQYRSGSLATAS